MNTAILIRHIGRFVFGIRDENNYFFLVNNPFNRGLLHFIRPESRILPFLQNQGRLPFASRAAETIQAAVLDGFCNFRFPYGSPPLQIRNGPGYLQNPVVGPGGEVQPFHGPGEELPGTGL